MRYSEIAPVLDLYHLACGLKESHIFAHHLDAPNTT